MTRHQTVSIAASLAVAAMFVSVTAVALPRVQAGRKGTDAARTAIAFPRGTGPVVLTNGTGDRSLTVTVDGYGSFGSDSAAGDAVFDPAGSIGPSTTVYASGVYFTPIEGFLATGGLNSLTPVSITQIDSATAESQFDIAGYRIHLVQSVRRTPNGSILMQDYTITNLSTSTRSFDVVRFVDGDLRFDSSISDFGAASADGRTLSEFDTGDDPNAASTYVGITDSGGTPDGFTIQEYPYDFLIVSAGGIPASDNGVIFGDGNGDRVTDFGYDVTLSLGSAFTLGPQATVTYSSVTRFGDQTLVPRATLTWDPPDTTSPLTEPPPRHLTSTPIVMAQEAFAEAVPASPRDVMGYSVYSSSSSPVVPGPDTFFTSVGPTQTSAAVPTGSGGSFFVVTANYPSGESGPSNEASADVPAASITSVKVTSAKVVGKGSGFSSVVTVFIDGIPFTSPAKVKGASKTVQKGTLVTGQTVGAYIASKGGDVLLQFRNSNGGIASWRYRQ